MSSSPALSFADRTETEECMAGYIQSWVEITMQLHIWIGGVVSHSRMGGKESTQWNPPGAQGTKSSFIHTGCVFAKNIRAAGAPELTRACFCVNQATLTI